MFGFTGQVSGERLCTEPSDDPPFTPASTCPYLIEHDNDTTGLDDAYVFLAGGSSLSFDLEAYSESSIETTPVPLPASGALLAFGIVGLAAAYRRKR